MWDTMSGYKDNRSLWSDYYLAASWGTRLISHVITKLNINKRLIHEACLRQPDSVQDCTVDCGYLNLELATNVSDKAVS